MEIKAAVELIISAKAILVLAGAGMSADHGTPVFVGDDGQYTLGVERYCKGVYGTIEELASPEALFANPDLFWTFYRERKEQLEAILPNVHQGYFDLLAVLRDQSRLGKTVGVVTTNTDGAFYASGCEFPIYEMHGSIEYLQCIRTSCIARPWPALSGSFNESSKCPVCGAGVRPNILMFGDFGYRENDNNVTNRHLQYFNGQSKSGTVALLVGSGKRIPTLNVMASRLIEAGGSVIVVNPDPRLPSMLDSESALHIKESAKDAIADIWTAYIRQE